MRFQTFAADRVDRTIEHVGDKILYAGIVENRYDDCGIEINQDVDIAVRAVIPTRDGAEQRGMGDALRPQIGLTLLQLLYDLVACHAPHCKAGNVKKHVLFCTSLMDRLHRRPYPASAAPSPASAPRSNRRRERTSPAPVPTA